MGQKRSLCRGARAALATVTALALLATTPLVSSADPEALQRQIDVLAEELARLRDELAIPETDAQLGSAYGMGPAASKVYGARQGISLGGYGEFFFAAPIEQTEETGAVNIADFYRFISYFGYKFSDRIVMNTEIEYEHGTTGGNFAGRGGAVSVEFAYLDFLLDPRFNVRAGTLLVPVGFVNEMHEPPFYHGNFRPETERSIIPSTWRELGVGAHGQLTDELRYTAYVINGLNGEKFDDEGVRGGRQKGNRALWEDVAGVLKLAWEPAANYGIAASGLVGQADQNRLFDAEDQAIEVTHWVAETHGFVRHRGFEARALVAMSGFDGVEELSELTGDTIPKSQLGWYLDVAYDLAPHLLGRDTTVSVSPWVRYEQFDLQREVGEGYTRDRTLDRQVLTVGVDFKPHPQVVLKGEYVHFQNAGDAIESDEIRVGAGFVY